MIQAAQTGQQEARVEASLFATLLLLERGLAPGSWDFERFVALC
jgi:hypothetical protein